MYEVFVWVPSKGWKKILGTKSQRKAVERALEFTPLEVKLTDGQGRMWCSGIFHEAVDGSIRLAPIEKLNETLCISA
jgi:hypothetical protein